MSEPPEAKTSRRRALDGAFIGLAFVTLAAISTSAIHSTFFRKPLLKGAASTLVMHISAAADPDGNEFRRVERFEQASHAQCLADLPAALADMRQVFKALRIEMTCIKGVDQ